jgi:hypothetical protein
MEPQRRNTHNSAGNPFSMRVLATTKCTRSQKRQSAFGFVSAASFPLRDWLTLPVLELLRQADPVQSPLKTFVRHKLLWNAGIARTWSELGILERALRRLAAPPSAALPVFLYSTSLSSSPDESLRFCLEYQTCQFSLHAEYCLTKSARGIGSPSSSEEELLSASGAR